MRAYGGARNFPATHSFVRNGAIRKARTMSEKVADDYALIGRRLREIEAEKVRLRAHLAVVMKAPKVEDRPTISQIWISSRL